MLIIIFITWNRYDCRYHCVFAQDLAAFPKVVSYLHISYVQHRAVCNFDMHCLQEAIMVFGFKQTPFIVGYNFCSFTKCTKPIFLIFNYFSLAKSDILFQFVPSVVEMCTRVVEEKGLDNQGIYRVPGNSGALNAMIDELNKVIQQICYVQGNSGVLIGIIWEPTACKNDFCEIFSC